MFNQTGSGSILGSLGLRKSKPLKPFHASNEEPQLIGAIRALGDRSEHMRSRCEAVLSTVGTFRTTSNEIEALFKEFGTIIGELQTTRNALGETEMALAAEINVVRDRTEENAALQATVSKLQREIESLSEAHMNSERRRETLQEGLRATQIELEDQTQTLRAVAAERTAVQGRAQQLANDGAVLAQKLKETEAALEEAKTERRVAQDKFQFEARERLKLAEANKELTDMYSQEKTNFLQASGQLDKAKQNINEITAQLNNANAAADALRTALRASESRREVDEVGFILKIETLTSRLELTEQLLTRAREESLRLGEEQSRHGETTRRLQQVQTEASALRSKLETTQKLAVELEQSRDAITARANDHLNELREKRALNEQAAERIASLQKFSESLKAEKERDIEKLKEQVKQLSELLAKEHAAREYAEGSLQAARRDRVQLQNTIMQIENSRSGKSGPSSIDAAQASSKDLLELQSKLEDGGKDTVEKLPRPQGAL